ncbi:MAG: ABC transporter ATP-binding protein [Desulfurococcaceae archaeon]|nr:ABC transporter ATP-binding protein [Desulfurococcaceae archaeon]
MTRVSLRRVVKRFGNVYAAKDVELDIAKGEFFALLGPSGCGKTTTLRIIAGFEYPDSGQVFFDEEDVTYTKPYERGTAMVFQNYALWPHMSVFDNVAYGLKVRKLPKEDIRRRVLEVLDLVGLRGLEDRYPLQLSGGQQQRVALARALVVEPKVLLLDEPLSNLDAKLRIRMREEIKKIQRTLNITTIYVTHDQEEAMSISDRVAVMNQGRILQVGTPQDIYFRPKNIFVATFIGKSTLLQGKVVKKDADRVVVDVGGEARIAGKLASDSGIKEGDDAVLVIKPEDFTVDPPEEPYNAIEGVVEFSMFLGSFTQLRMSVANQNLKVFIDPKKEVKPGSKFVIYVKIDDVLVFPRSEEVLEVA